MPNLLSTLTAGTTAMLRSLGQIIFQENALSGLFIVLGIALNDASMLFPCLLATVIAITTAHLCGFSKAAISQGLYGFNGALVGLAVAYFYQESLTYYALLAGGSVVATLIAHLLSTRTPIKGFTFPFVATTWALFAVAAALGMRPSVQGGLMPAGLQLGTSLSLSFGQILFQDKDLAAGLCFFLAILINKPSQALLALLSVALTWAVLWTPMVSAEKVSAGIYGYNAILCAIAVGGFSWKSMWQGIFAVALSVVFQYVGMQQGITTLTAPFVFAVWVVLLWGKFVSKKR